MFIVLLIVCVLLEIFMFCKQRAALEISRMFNMGIDFRELILPPWFIISYVTPFINMYCVSQVFDLAWYFCIPVYLVYMFLSCMLPIDTWFYINALDKIVELQNEGTILPNAYLDMKIEQLYSELKS